MADRMAIALKALDELAWWHTHLTCAPSAATTAREALMRIRGGDGRPPTTPVTSLEELRGLVQELNAHDCTVLNNADGDLIVILPDHMAKAVKDRVAAQKVPR